MSQHALLSAPGIQPYVVQSSALGCLEQIQIADILARYANIQWNDTKMSFYRSGMFWKPEAGSVGSDLYS